MKFLGFLLLVIISLNANATTWGKTEVKDPLNDKATCSVHVLGSTGSYVYQYPSKYDQVFSPYTTQNGIWYCEASGFIALMGDFKDISDTEKSAISNYLKVHKPKLTDISSRLKHLEEIYNLRTKKKEFKNRLKRIIAYMYEQSGEVIIANNYRREALTDIKKSLNGKLKEYKKLEYLYLAANYERQFGNKKQSDKYILELKESINNVEDDTLEGYSEYLSKLLEETIFIKKGGILKPELPKNN